MTQPPIGQLTERVRITNITNSSPTEVTTETEHGFSTGQFVRLTELNGAIPIPHGEDQLNNMRFKIVKTSNTTFYLYYPVTNQPVDSTTYPPYVLGGSCNLVQSQFIYYPSPDQVYPN
jgi:hypothetical protein